MSNKKNGFTLIELLVVIAIIALLLSILMPALSKVKQQARTIICKTNLKSVGMIVLLYLEDNREKSYDTKLNGFLWKDENTGEFRNLTEAENDSGYAFDTYWGLAYKSYIDDEPDMFECPDYKPLAGFELIYNVDPMLSLQAAFGLNNNFREKNVLQLTPSKFIVTHDHVEPTFEGGNDCFAKPNSSTPNLTKYRESEGGSRYLHYPGIFRHNVKTHKVEKTGGLANMLWLDGHVTSLDETTGEDVKKSWYTGNRKDNY